jgi:glycosyltransferase involved in cell wall biosynthesis
VENSEWVPSRKITVIYNGYAPDTEHSIAQRDAQGIDSLSDHVPVVGIVANLRPIKRIDVLVRAFATLKVSHPAARLVIVGDYSSPQARSTRDSLEVLADRLEISDRIIFTGRVADPSRYVRRFSIAVLCSESEGFSNSLVEYMRYRRAIVCTDTGGNSEIIQDGHNGFLVPVGDASILAERLAQLLSDTALAQRFGDNAHAAVQSYSHVKMVSMQMRSYDEILQNLG